MEVWVRIIIKIVAGVMSILDASNLRTRLYEVKDEHEVMWTALDDIARMYPDSSAGKYAKETLKQIKHTYGR